MAINQQGDWFIYYFSRGRYLRQWSKMPTRKDGALREIRRMLDSLHEIQQDQLTFCGFGTTPNSFFIRATDPTPNRSFGIQNGAVGYQQIAMRP